MPRKKTDGGQVFQLKVTLKYIRPPIWRRIQVRGGITLDQLHLILQPVMGWQGYHLHLFEVDGIHYGEPDPGWDVENEQRITLDRAVSEPGDKFIYKYDMGDGWEHEILVEKVLAPEPGVHYPVCLKGKRACPPEDCGGPWGYAEFLNAISDPKHPDHKDMLEWVGDEFDPEEFDLEAVNRVLSSM